MSSHHVVSSEEWLKARKELLKTEKALTRLRDEVSRRRLELPWHKMEASYVFDAPEGKVTLADLFDGRSQLMIYHFMFGPEWEEGCPSCSLIADHINASFVHLAQRDVTLAVVSRAPLAKLEAFKKRLGWRFNWVSSLGSDFNQDYRVSFTRQEIEQGKPYNYNTADYPNQEAHGVSVFFKDQAGDIFHTYSTYGRGIEDGLGVYTYLDLAPKGRNEAELPWPMAWVRHHDRYVPQETYVLKTP